MYPSGNNSFGGYGGASSGEPIVSGGMSDGGDIVLTSPSQKTGGSSKMKKWAVALGVGFLILAIILAVMAVLAGTKKEETSYSSRELFNKYANGFLYGTESMDEITVDEMENSETFFGKQQNDGFQDENYVARTIDDFVKFKEKYLSDNANNEYANNLLNNYLKELKLVTTFYGGAYLTLSSVVEAFGDGQTGDWEEPVNAIVNQYAGVGDIYGRNYYSLLSEWSKNAISVVKQYYSAGCLAGGQINYNCAGLNGNQTIEKLNSDMLEEKVLMNGIMQNSVKDVYMNVFSMKDILWSTTNNE